MADSDDQSDDYPDNRPLARCGHIACSVDRFMIIWGGYRVVTWDEFMQEEYLPTHELWVYDTDSEIWFRKETFGHSPKGTSGAAATVIDHRLYIFGGFSRSQNLSQNVNHTHCLDLNTLAWVNLQYECGQEYQPSPRDKHSIWDYRNKLYVFGGFGPPIHLYLSDHGQFELDQSTTYFSYVRGWNNQVLVYDVNTKEWSNPPLSGIAPSPRAAMAVSRLDNRVIVFGGRNKEIRMNDLHCLNLDTMTWTQLMHMSDPIPVGRTWHTFSKMSSSELFMYGGFTQEKEPLSDAWILDVDKCQWRQLPVASDKHRLWHTSSSSNNGDILVFGGCCNNILDAQTPVHTNETLVFRLSPRSLVRHSLDAVFKYRDKLQKDWPSLPKSLHDILVLRLEYLISEDDARYDQENVNRNKRRGSHLGCSVS